MNQRKLIKLGNSSFAIALPKQWVDKSGLKKGDSIFLEENNNGGLYISTEYSNGKSNSKEEINLDLKDKDDVSMQVNLIAAYLHDHNIFKIKNNLEHKKRVRVKELVKNLMSFEILEENKDEIKIKDVFSLEEADIKLFIRRVDNILRSFFEDIGESIKSGKLNKEIVNEMNLADKEITKLYLLIGRIFIKSLNNPSVLNSLKMNYLELFISWWMSLHLEKIGDELKRIAALAEKDPTILTSKFFINTLEKIKNNYFDCINSYHKKDPNLTKSIIDSNFKIMDECNDVDPNNISIAKAAEKLKVAQDSIFQISKMIFYIN